MTPRFESQHWNLLMKLVLFTNSYPYTPGEEFIETEIAFLALQFSDVVIFPLRRGKAQRPVPDNIRVDDSLAKFLENGPSSNVKRTISLFAAEPWQYLFSKALSKMADVRLVRQVFAQWNAAGEIYQWMLTNNEFQPNSETVYYTYWFSSATTALARFSKEQGDLDFVTRCHGGDLYKHRVYQGVFPFREYVLDEIRSVHACSEDGRQHLVENYGAWEDKLKVARLGVVSAPENPWSIEENTIRVCSCAYVTAVKRMATLCEALKMIVEQDQSARVIWTHFGDGPLLEDLKAQAESAVGLELDFRGSLSNSDILACYRQQPFDVFVNCSSSEGLPVSIMEAMSYGIPVVAPDVGGISELVSRKNGWLVESECTPQQVVDAIRRVAAKPHARRANARATWKKYVDAESNYHTFAKMLSESSPADI